MDNRLSVRTVSQRRVATEWQRNSILRDGGSVSGAARLDALALVNFPTEAALLADLEACLARGQGFAIATLNLDHVVKLRRDPAFRAAYSAQSHVVADGNPIVWMAHLAGRRDVALVPGSELIAPVAAMAARLGIPLVRLLLPTDTAAEAMRGAKDAMSSSCNNQPLPMAATMVTGAASAAAVVAIAKQSDRLSAL